MQTRHNIGFVRITIYVLLPLLCSLFVVVSVSTCVHNYLKEEMEEERAKAEAHEAESLRKTQELAVAKLRGGIASTIAGKLRAAKKREDAYGGSMPYDSYGVDATSNA